MFYTSQILPGVYIFTTAQTTETYEAMWEKLFEIIPQMKHSVNHVSMDYEPAAIKAVRSKFPPENSVKISVCDFHHVQVKFIELLEFSSGIQGSQMLTFSDI